MLPSATLESCRYHILSCHRSAQSTVSHASCSRCNKIVNCVAESIGSSVHLLAEQVHAGPELLRHFPPLLLIVGGTEILMAENLLLAQKAQVCITKLKMIS